MPRFSQQEKGGKREKEPGEIYNSINYLAHIERHSLVLQSCKEKRMYLLSVNDAPTVPILVLSRRFLRVNKYAGGLRVIILVVKNNRFFPVFS